MNRSHSSHSNATPQYSQSPHASYNNVQQSAYNTVINFFNPILQHKLYCNN